MISSKRRDTASTSSPGFTSTVTKNILTRWNDSTLELTDTARLLIAHQNAIEARAVQPAKHLRCRHRARACRHGRPGTAHVR
jgi:hypothetical protein